MHVFSFIRAICLIFEMLYFVGHTSENIGERRERCIKSVKSAVIAYSVKQQPMETNTQTLPLTLNISLHPLRNHGKQTERRTNTPEIPGLLIRICIILGSWIRIRIVNLTEGNKILYSILLE
jgi:hypothetical protein